MLAVPSEPSDHFEDEGSGAVGVEVLRCGVFVGFVALGDDADDFVGGEGVVEEFFAFGAANGEGCDGTGEADGASDGEEREDFGDLDGLEEG